MDPDSALRPGSSSPLTATDVGSFGESTVVYAAPARGEMQWTAAGMTMKFKLDGKDYPDPWGGTSA